MTRPFKSPLPRKRIAEARARVAALLGQKSRDTSIGSKRTRNIRNEKSYAGWLRDPSVGDLIDPFHPRRVFDADLRTAKQKALAAHRRQLPSYKRQLERRKHASPQAKPKSKSKSPRPKLRRVPTKRPRLVQKRRHRQRLAFRPLLAKELRRRLPSRALILSTDIDLEAASRLCARKDCADYEIDEIAAYVEASSWKAAVYEGDRLVAVVLGQPRWKLDGDWYMVSQGKEVADKMAYLVLLCSAPGSGYGAALLQSFVALAKRQGAKWLVMDVGGSCPVPLVNWYKRQLPQLESVQLHKHGRATRRVKSAYTGLWGDMPANLYATPI